MATIFQHRRGHYLILSAAATLLFFVNLGAASLWDVDEGRNATCAHEMRESANWIVPTYNGVLRPDKPVLLYWLQAYAYSFFGVTAFAARLPSALAALLTLFLAYELGRKLFGKTTGLLGALIAAGSPMFVGAARFANPDSLLHLFTVLTLLIFWMGHRQPSVRWWLLLGAACGGGMLAKGPVAVVLPGLITGVYLLWENRWRQVLRRRWGWGFLSGLVVAGPWYIWVTVETKARFLSGFFGRHHVDRFLTPLEGHWGTPLYYPSVLLLGLAPWSAFLLFALWCGYWSARARVGSRWQATWDTNADRRQCGHPEIAPPPCSVYRFLLCWIGVYLLFFTLAATKLPNYVLAAVVPCALLTARLLERWRTGVLNVPVWLLPTAFTLWVLFGISVMAGMSVAGGAIPIPALAGRTFPDMLWLSWLGMIPIASGLAAWMMWRHGRRTASINSLTVATIAVIGLLASWTPPAADFAKPAETLVAQAGALRRDEDIRIVACGLSHLASLNFYTQRDVIHLGDADELAGYLRYPLRVYAFLPTRTWDEFHKRYPQLGRELSRCPDLYLGAEVMVVTNW